MQSYVTLASIADNICVMRFISIHFLQEKIMRNPYGKDFFKYSLFLVFCNRLTTSAVSAGALLVSSFSGKFSYLSLFGHENVT